MNALFQQNKRAKSHAEGSNGKQYWKEAVQLLHIVFASLLPETN